MTRKILHFKNRIEWRRWLKFNHDSEKEIWMVFYKKHTGKVGVIYNDAVEEAICYGWIDSIIKRVDDEKYIQKFTPRTDFNKWSDLNISRIKKMIKQKKMTKIGLAKINKKKLKENKKENGNRNQDIALTADLEEIIRKNIIAWSNFQKTTPSHRKICIRWVMDGKKEETRIKRINEIVELMEKGKKLGMK